MHTQNDMEISFAFWHYD